MSPVKSQNWTKVKMKFEISDVIEVEFNPLHHVINLKEIIIYIGIDIQEWTIDLLNEG